MTGSWRETVRQRSPWLTGHAQPAVSRTAGAMPPASLETTCEDW